MARRKKGYRNRGTKPVRRRRAYAGKSRQSRSGVLKIVVEHRTPDPFGGQLEAAMKPRTAKRSRF